MSMSRPVIMFHIQVHVQNLDATSHRPYFIS